MPVDRHQLREALVATAFALFLVTISFFPVYEMWWLRLVTLGPLFALALFTPRRKRFSWRDLPMWVLAGVFALGIAAAVHRPVAWRWGADLVLLLPILYYSGKALADRPERMERTALLITVAGSLVALYSLVEVGLGVNIIHEYLLPNPYYAGYQVDRVPLGTQYHPAPLATYLLWCLPFALCTAARPGRTLRRYGVLASGFLLAALLCTLSRSSYMGLVAAVVLYFVLRKQYLRALAPVLAGVAFMAFASTQPWPLYRLSFRGLFMERGGIVSAYRMSRIDMALAMCREHPLTGVGPGNYRELFETYAPPREDDGSTPYPLQIADNTYPALLAEYGALGAGAFVTFILLLWTRGYHVLRAGPDPRRRRFVTACLLGLVAFLVSAAGYEALYWNAPFMLFSLLTGLLSGATLPWPDEKDPFQACSGPA